MARYAAARLGYRSEGLKSIDQAISYYESAPRGKDTVNIQRYLALSHRKRPDILLTNGDDKGALASYRLADAMLTPLAKADPEIDMLRLDVSLSASFEGRVLASQGRYDEALPKFKSSLMKYKRHQTAVASNPDMIHDSGWILVGLGESHLWRRDFAAAKQAFQQAAAALAPEAGATPDDDTLCIRATAYLKLGDTLATAGSLNDARTAYQQARSLLTPHAAPQNQNVPALYPIANAYEELGDVASALASRTRDTNQRSLLRDESCAFYRKSQDTWRQIPNPSRIDPSGFLPRSPSEVTRRLAGCKRAWSLPPHIEWNTCTQCELRMRRPGIRNSTERFNDVLRRNRHWRVDDPLVAFSG